jgi:PAS domain S-box-containing protein
MIEDREFFETLVQNGSDAIVSINEESEIVFANDSVERVFGYTPEEVEGAPLTTVMPDRFEDAHFEAIRAYIETGERNLDWNDIQLPAVHKDGHEVQLSITFEEHKFGDERYFSGIMRDVTERVERERQLERQNEQLEKFASIVSHDLRDPLNTAQATLTLAEAEHGESEYLEELEEIHDRMEALIEDVLELTKQGQAVGEAEPVELAAVIDDAWGTAGGPSATLHVEDGLGEVRADHERLRTLFENLFGNAIRHAGEEPAVTVGALPDGFYVEDDGPGIPEDEREDVFDYGYTTETDGTGFGLNIVKTIADAHGWNPSVTAAENGGARFEFSEVGK